MEKPISVSEEHTGKRTPDVLVMSRGALKMFIPLLPYLQHPAGIQSLCFRERVRNYSQMPGGI